MKYFIEILLFIHCLLLPVVANECQEAVKEYNRHMAVNLKNGYRLYATLKGNNNESEMDLILKKNEKHISNINGLSCGLSLYNLGFVVADFQESFLFVQTFGSGNPQMIKLVNKKTAKTVIKFEGFIANYNIQNEFFIYRNNSSKSTNLFDIKNHKNYTLNIDDLIINTCHLRQVDDENECLNSDEISDGYIDFFKITNSKIVLKIGQDYKIVYRK